MSAGYLDLTKHQAYSNCASDETWTTIIIDKLSLVSCAQLNSTQRTALFFYLALVELHMILLLKLLEVLCGDSLLQYRLHVHLFLPLWWLGVHCCRRFHHRLFCNDDVKHENSYSLDDSEGEHWTVTWGPKMDRLKTRSQDLLYVFVNFGEWLQSAQRPGRQRRGFPFPASTCSPYLAPHISDPWTRIAAQEDAHYNPPNILPWEL